MHLLLYVNYMNSNIKYLKSYDSMHMNECESFSIMIDTFSQNTVLYLQL